MKPLSILSASAALCVGLVSTFASAAFTLPKYEHYTMENGLEVYLMPQTEVPLVDVVLAVKAGSLRDGKQYGLAAMTGESLQFGAGNLSKTELEDRFAHYGAEFDSSVSSETTELSLSFAAADTDIMMPLLAKVLLKPKFDSEEFSKYKKRFLSQLEQTRERPRQVKGGMLRHLFYGEHPYGAPSQGNEKTVAKISRDDVKRFYQQNFVPSNAAIIVVGDINTKKWRKSLEAMFSSWQGEAGPAQTIEAPMAPDHARVLLVNKGDATETSFVLGGVGHSAKHPDAVAARVVNTLVGGRFTSWLNEELRTNSGLSYGARSAFSKNKLAGLFYVSSFTKTETTFEAIDLALKTYSRLWLQGIDAAGLASAKAYVKGLFPPDFETPSQLSALLAYLWSMDLDDSYINKFEERVDALDLEHANALAKTLFPRDKLQFVLVGKAEALREGAKKYGDVKEVDIKEFYHP